MYQREAMWISFVASRKFVVKIYVGGINVISGEPMVENRATKLRRSTLLAEGMTIQDYIILPKQTMESQTDGGRRQEDDPRLSSHFLRSTTPVISRETA